MTIGQQLKNARVASGVTQTEIAKRYECSFQGIAFFENAKSLSTKTIEKYLACLGKTFEIVISDKVETE